MGGCWWTGDDVFHDIYLKSAGLVSCLRQKQNAKSGEITWHAIRSTIERHHLHVLGPDMNLDIERSLTLGKWACHV